MTYVLNHVKRICPNIIDAFKSNWSHTGLPFPCVITRLIKAQKVPIRPQDVRAKPLSAIGSCKLQLSLSHMKRARESDFESEDDLDREIE